MRALTLSVAGVGAAALAAMTAFAGTAGAGTGPAPAHQNGPVTSGPTIPGKGECYGNMMGDTGSAIVSQNFAAGMTQYNSAGATDFPAGTCITLTSVGTTGMYFNGSGPAASVNVLYYNSQTSARVGLVHPGSVLAEYDNLAYKDSTGLGSLSVKIPKTKTKKGGWISFVVNMDFAVGGEWGWEVSSTQPGNPDVWENPGGGFGVCPTWDINVNCTGIAGDYMVSLIGKAGR